MFVGCFGIDKGKSLLVLSLVGDTNRTRMDKMDSNNLKTELLLAMESELALLNQIAFTYKLNETQRIRAIELDKRIKLYKAVN